MRSASGIRQAPKAGVDLGLWKTGQKFPKNGLNLRSPYPVTGQWSWRQIRFQAGDDRYSILIKCRPERLDFMAMLVHCGQPDTVLCRVEHHGSHPGWHLHYQCKRPFFQGVVSFPDMRRRGCGHTQDFGSKRVTGFEAWAITFVVKAFGLEEKGQIGDML